MAGFSRIYVVGGQGGFGGADGANPIEFLILVGDADRQWMESHYFDASIEPLGRLRVLVPSAPGAEDALLDACVAFSPKHFQSCPAIAEVDLALRGMDQLDLNACSQEVSAAWTRLREEARPLFGAMHIWRADLVPVEGR